LRFGGAVGSGKAKPGNREMKKIEFVQRVTGHALQAKTISNRRKQSLTGCQLGER
jgi:hypothetical protein